MASSQPRRSVAGCHDGSYPTHLMRYCHRPLSALPQSRMLSNSYSSVSSSSSFRTTTRPWLARTSYWVASCLGRPTPGAPPRCGRTIDTWKVLKIFMLVGSRSVTIYDDILVTSNGPSHRMSSFYTGLPVL
jgi:hypothetical protein